jgi:hypothetical protein
MSGRAARKQAKYDKLQSRQHYPAVWQAELFSTVGQKPGCERAHAAYCALHAWRLGCVAACPAAWVLAAHVARMGISDELAPAPPQQPPHLTTPACPAPPRPTAVCCYATVW